MTKLLLPLLLITQFACLTTLAPAQGKATDQYIPQSTSVALVPVINLSGEKDPSFKADQTKRGNEELAREFTEHGFKLVDQQLIDKSIADLKIDLNDEEQQKRDTLYKIGKEVKADLIAFVLITDVSKREINNVFSSAIEGRAKIKVWLLDVNAEKPIRSSFVMDSKTNGSAAFGATKGSERIVAAVGKGIEEALKDFFKPYPKVKKEAKSNAILVAIQPSSNHVLTGAFDLNLCPIWPQDTPYEYERNPKCA